LGRGDFGGVGKGKKRRSCTNFAMMLIEIAQEKIEFFRKNLLGWYRKNGRKFPWRKKGLSHYEYVIAEVLLQRTKAETVSKFYLAFMKNFPNWEALNNANIKDLEQFLQPVGLYRQRSKRLMSLAAEMVKRNGVLPEDRAELESIPFMGQYISNAVELIVFGRPQPLIDVNMARVLERFFRPRKKVDIRYDPYLQRLALMTVNGEKSKEINWAILDFAALVCKVKVPDCNSCPVSSKCTYFSNAKSHQSSLHD
jgi:A/G-specific adenine glycosylase